MIKGIDVVFLHSMDQDLSGWYKDVLGLSILTKDGPWTEYSTTTRTRFAIEYTSASDSPIENQPIMVSFRVDDIQAAVKTLAARGVQFHPSPEKTIFLAGPSLVATFKDPAGNWLQLSQPVPRQ